MYSSLSGIITNQSEGFNTVLKQYQHWKEIPVDSLVLGLYRLQIYYYNEVQRGYCELGDYNLRPQYSSLSRPSDEALFHHVPSPEEIVSLMHPKDDDDDDVGKVTDSKLETPVETLNSNDFDDENSDSIATVSDISQVSRAR